jgi:hypothetical protein
VGTARHREEPADKRLPSQRLEPQFEASVIFPQDAEPKQKTSRFSRRPLIVVRRQSVTVIFRGLTSRFPEVHTEKPCRWWIFDASTIRVEDERAPIM